MAPTRYIGITDFTTYEQVEEMYEVCKKFVAHESVPKLHVGVMMSYKTLNSLPTKWANAYPSKQTIAQIFSTLPVMNCLHYADYTNTNVASSLISAIGWGGDNLHALQLDMVWPDPSVVCFALHAAGMRLEVILQINAEAMRHCDDTPVAVAKRLDNYQGVATHVLLDKSMGRGKGMDAEALIPYAEAISERHPELGLVVAGGLGPYTGSLAQPFLRRFPMASVDAQGQLRSSGSALDPIEWDRATTYLKNMLLLMQ